MYGILKIALYNELNASELKEKFLIDMFYTHYDEYEYFYGKYKKEIDEAYEQMIRNLPPSGWNEVCLYEPFEEFFRTYTDYDEGGESKYVKLYKEGIQKINGRFYSCFIFKYDNNYYNSLENKDSYDKITRRSPSDSMLDLYFESEDYVINLFKEKLNNIEEIKDYDPDVGDAYANAFGWYNYHVLFEFSETIDSNIEGIDNSDEEANETNDNIKESIKEDVKSYKGLYYFVNDNNEVTITSGDKQYNKKVLNIPKTIDGRLVTTIGTGAFQGNETIEEVFIPDTINCINDFAFSNCKKLEKLHIDHNVETVFPNAFRNSDLLRFVYGPTQTKEMFEWAAGQMLIETPRRNTIDDNWLDNMFSGFYITNHPKKSVLTGFDDDYDGFGKEIKKSKEGFPYFLNDNNEAIITRHITIEEDNIIIPNKVDGHKVVAIGSYAFTNARYSSIVIPDSVEVIAAAAFFNTTFDYLKLPKSLIYLNESFICNGKTTILKNRIKDGNDVINNPCFVIMPEEIQQLDAGIMDNHRLEGHTLIFEYTPKYKDKYENFNHPILNTSVLYDNDSNSIYVIKNNNACILSNYQIDNGNKVPREIGSHPVTMLDSNYVNDANGYITYKGEVPDANGDNLIIKGKNFKIPFFITEITNYLGVRASLCSSSINFSMLQIIDGIEIQDYFILPNTVKEIRNVSGIILIPKNMDKPLIEECDSVYYDFIGIEQDESFNYIIVDKNDETVAIAINKKSKYDECVLKSYINDKRIVGCRINASEISILKIDNIFFESNIEDFNFDIYDITKVAIGESIKKVKDIYNFIIVGQIEEIYVKNGVEEFLDKPGRKENYIAKLFGAETRKTVFLPKSIKRIGTNAFNSDITTVKLNSNPEIAPDAFARNTYVENSTQSNYGYNNYSAKASVSNTVNSNYSSESIANSTPKAVDYMSDSMVTENNIKNSMRNRYRKFLKLGNIFNLISFLLGVLSFIITMTTGFYGISDGFFIFVYVFTVLLSALLLYLSRFEKNPIVPSYMIAGLSFIIVISLAVKITEKASKDNMMASVFALTVCMYFMLLTVPQSIMYQIAANSAKKAGIRLSN